ncbi:hypothetical protein Nepgr_011192 [Nepenthes gracilis]|uniref:Uncharacterized protein n=1 Tax=Nepenthes gracilis TaxID=150966 RepID=A0AAD3SEQ2_NEPGR|nr:hypothetical protein Nepgr_011192 [Nepenthes gracilis]
MSRKRSKFTSQRRLSTLCSSMLPELKLLNDLKVLCLLRLKESAVLLRCQKDDLHWVESIFNFGLFSSKRCYVGFLRWQDCDTRKEENGSQKHKESVNKIFMAKIRKQLFSVGLVAAYGFVPISISRPLFTVNASRSETMVSDL